MKKAFQISIAETLFTIEEDAHKKLERYLESVKEHFKGVEGEDEIVRDIETRIAEQLLESKRTVITLVEVDAVIASMGTVEDFDGEAKASSDRPAGRSRKLYRDADNPVLGGVCSGIAIYLGIDPLWIRVLFVILALSTGFAVALYIILWIFLPEAKTPSQKLEMAGEPVNIETLSETMRDKAREVDEKHGGSLRRGVSKIRGAIIQIAKALAKAIVAIFGALRIAIGALITAASFLAVFALSFALPLALTNIDSPYVYAPFIQAMPFSLILIGALCAYMTLAIPFIFLMLLAIGMLRKAIPLRLGAGVSLLCLWCAAVIGAGVIGVNAAARYDELSQSDPRFQTVSRDLAIEGSPTAISVEDGIRLTVVSAATTALAVRGPASSLDRVTASVEDGSLTISRGSSRRSDVCLFCPHGSVEATLSLARLDSLSVAEGSRVDVSSWKSKTPISVKLENGSRAEISADVPALSAEARFGSRLVLSGRSASSTLSASYGSRIEAEGFSMKTLDARARMGGIVEYSGNPALTEDTSDGGEVRAILAE